MPKVREPSRIDPDLWRGQDLRIANVPLTGCVSRTRNRMLNYTREQSRERYDALHATSRRFEARADKYKMSGLINVPR